MSVVIDRVVEYRRVMAKLQNSVIRIGIFGQGDAKILLIATVNEFGANINVTDRMRNYLRSQGLFLKDSTTQIRIPERSFIRTGFEKNRERLKQSIEEDLIRVLTLDMDVNVFLNKVGNFAVGLIQKYLRDLREPPNHPFTIEQKGSSNPLIDTGALISRITYKIERA